MSTDRELLKLAAKAMHGELAQQMLESGWNPLTDDGDAFRLSVKINEMRVFVYDDHVSMGTLQIVEPHTGDACSAARRAIARAAAEIGKALS